MLWHYHYRVLGVLGASCKSAVDVMLGRQCFQYNILQSFSVCFPLCARGAEDITSLFLSD